MSEANEGAALEAAIALAAKVHAGQRDKAGAPYILHPLRLMLKFADAPARMAAVLHDVVEDGGVTFEQLRALGIPENVIAAVDGLTRRENESYQEFVARATQDPIALRVKIEDVRDNMDITRLAQLTPKDVERLNRYHAALRVLLAAQAGGVANPATPANPVNAGSL
jgi:(p)ppGpp synthase/HD superfamily hydrolase